ncbi:MAG: flavin reductase family protein [Syntrophomonadaceae bacterium]|nr:flavin reductase family protein [Syntrophomonadaceae bacterium]
MSIRRDFFENATELLTQLPRGAFLSVRANGIANTMTIGWGMMGFIWRKPILMVMVRFSRHTYGLMEASDTFTVSFPSSDQYKELLAQVGQLSGRDIDKFKDLHIPIQEAQTVDGSVIDNCGLTIECRTLYKQAMNPNDLDEEIRTNYYADDDYHMLYFGEVLACYHNDQG